MSKLYLYNYNNYFNRIVKRETSLANYGTPIYSLTATNFNYNDGVETYHDINYAGFDGNYLIVTDDNDNIVSRWFIKENKRLRGGQHRITLRRDLIVDNYEKVITAPALIYRGMINNINNPLLYNSEGFNCNQIKKNEILLKDKTLMPWYIIYFPLNVEYPAEQTDFTGSFNINDEMAVDEFSNYDINSNNSPWKAGSNYSFVDNYQFYINFNPEGFTKYTPSGLTYWCNVYQLQIPNNLLINIEQYGQEEDFIWFDENAYIVTPKLINIFSEQVIEENLIPQAENQYLSGRTIRDKDWFNQINKWNGKTLTLQTNVNGVVNYYNVTVNFTKITRREVIGENTILFDKMKQIIDDAEIPYTGDIDDLSFEISFDEYRVTISTSSIQNNNTINWSLQLDSHVKCKDAPYQIIAIPAGDLNVQRADSGNCWSTPQISEMLVNSIIQTCTSTNILDVQLLPYFPYINYFGPDKIFDLGNGKVEMEIFNQYSGQTPEFVDFISSRQYQHGNIDSSEIPSGYGYNIFYIDSANFTFNIEKSISIPNRSDNLVLNKKLSNELDLVRLCSPNYNGQFEFSIAKNDGVDYFNVDVTLKPYNPYIHINPNFKGLYGIDYNDARGLICNGDFSLPIVNDPWRQYELQNKNYQQIFNRQIEHMDFEFSKQRTEALFGATMGALGGAMSGAVGGSVIGGTTGAGAGALIGGVASAVGGAIDYSILKERQAEQKDLTLDMFEYQLGNIKALPYSLTKVTPLTYNNKLFPFIEYYTSTDEEVNILKTKIKYNSMTINAIGNIEEYIQSEKNYLAASLIRLEDLDMPTHEANEIYDEILKGVYI